MGAESLLTREDLEKWAEMCTLTLQPEPGFMKCVVCGHPPTGLRYCFSTLENAEAFRRKRISNKSRLPMSIEGTDVIEDWR